ncbi:hypothetical protein HanHA300_Chr01g0026641 [Helianthus annuus]|nr:hypothetical protein HanHA300_Chr01g0026641 [Helianthus annuus]KAJ0783999.1 hypothetical protein HanLR1_Chr01g0027271 [Helianthus annuus]
MAQRRKIETPVTNKPDIGLDLQQVATDVAKLYQESLNLRPISFDAGRRHSLLIRLGIIGLACIDFDVWG